MGQNPSIYEQRGVSFTKSDVYQALKFSSAGMFEDTFCKILSDLACQDPMWVNILHSDTAGTKPVIAYLWWKETRDHAVFSSLVQDAIVMNTDDMACAGCTGPFLISATLGRNKKLIPGEVVSEIIKAAEEFCAHMAQYDCTLVVAGGETADVGDIIRTLDVGYTLFGRFKKEDVMRISIKPGDLVVGFASSGTCVWENFYNSGIGSNGLTSARHDLLSFEYYQRYPETVAPEIPSNLCYQGPYKLSDQPLPEMPELGRLLLSPTRTYLPLIKSLTKNLRFGIHGLIHCTGGGQTKVNKFLPSNVSVVKDNLFPLPPIFNLIRQVGKTSLQEMFQVYNMGHRLEAYMDASAAEEAIAIARSFDIDARIIGSCIETNQSGVKIDFEEHEFFYPANA